MPWGLYKNIVKIDFSVIVFLNKVAELMAVLYLTIASDIKYRLNF